MTIGSVLALIASHRVGLRQRMLAQAEIGAVDIGDLRRLIGAIPTGDFTFSPAVGYIGFTSFTYTIDDGNGNTSTASVNITVEELIDPPANLVAEYRMDECGFDGTIGDVIDNTINRLNGRTFGGTSVSAGQICSAATFGGTVDYILVLDDQLFDFSNNDELTISFWVYVVDSATTRGLMGKSNTTVSTGWAFDIDDQERVTFRIGDDDNNNFVRSGSLSNGWNHVVGVLNVRRGADMFLYINNVSAGNDNASRFTNSNNPLFIGASDNTTSLYIGKIDEVKIFNTALSTGEITAMYTNEQAGRNWNNTTDTRVCNTCQCTAKAGSNMVSFPADLRNMPLADSDIGSVITGNISTYSYGASPQDWQSQYVSTIS